jgi:hypothetical protein
MPGMLARPGTRLITPHAAPRRAPHTRLKDANLAGTWAIAVGPNGGLPNPNSAGPMVQFASKTGGYLSYQWFQGRT